MRILQILPWQLTEISLSTKITKNETEIKNKAKCN